MGQQAASGERSPCFCNCSEKLPVNVQVITEPTLCETAEESKTKAPRAASLQASSPSQRLENQLNRVKDKVSSTASTTAPDSRCTSPEGSATGEPGLAESLAGTECMSETSYVANAAAMSKEQKQSAKRLVKDFVQKMVKGRQLAAILPSGQVRLCFCALSRTLDKLQIRANEKDKQGRNVLLSSIAEIVVGSDTSASDMCGNLETPLDDFCVTLMLDSEESITFRLDDMESRDKLAICLSMFSDRARGPDGG